MLILAWNCHGMARPLAIRNLKAPVCSFNPSCIFIHETKIDVNRVAVVVERMGFCKHCLIPSMGIAGGLCLAWKDGVDIEVTLANQFLINAMVFFDPPNQPWMMTFVHAPHNCSGRSIFWDQLNFIGSSFRGLWLCAGDFNCILSQFEKKGGKIVGDLTRSELKPFLDSGELIDLGFKGNSFTWTNKRMGKANQGAP
jgi:hypothetical protein